MANAVTQFIRRKDRRDRQMFHAYDALIASPADLGTVADLAASSALTLPANGRLAISHSVALSAEDVNVDIAATKNFSHGALDADQIFKGGFGEEGKDVVVNRDGAPAGDFSLYVVNPFGVPFVIATVTFSA